VPERLRAVHADHRQGYLKELQARPMGIGRDLYGLRKDGSEFPIEIGLTPIRTEEGVLVIATIVDITERKHAEEALLRRTDDLRRSNAELEQFAYVSSHDLQEPLRMVSSYVQLLAKRYKGRLDEDADVFIGFAVEGAARMQQLINDLLVYSRVGTQAKPFAHTDLEMVFDHAIANLQVSIQESQAVITHDPLPSLWADPVQMVQLLQNLIGNAIKFCTATPPRVHIRAERQQAAWRFSVQDNGIGIDPKFAERIFIIFQRLNTRAEYAGTGIGLAICKKIVERHGGRIWAEPATEQGSIFLFTVPDQVARYADA
jgi:light-regulated signal transduction histidine kinase (bacteriophytochrome)